VAETDAEIQLRNVINDVRTNCGGISTQMESLKKMAGIGTVVNAVGSVAGVGGMVAGSAKARQDTKTIQAIAELENSPENRAALENLRGAIMDSNAKENILALARQKMTDNSLMATVNESQKKSNQLGNLRTGLFATNTATSVAGAVVSSKTKIDENLNTKVKLCKESIGKIRDASTRMRTEDRDNLNTALLQQSQSIIDNCSEYETVDMEPINKLSKGATISGGVGAVTGAAATIASAVGTNKKVTDFDVTSSDGLQKDIKKLNQANVTSNLLGGITAGTSVAGTILNATQIKKIKQLVALSEKCEGVLQ
jgi:hypothetical protein